VRPEVAAAPGFRERFRTGVEAARAVSGDFVLPVVGADPDAPSPWSATASVPGLPLRQAVERHGPLPEPALRRLAGGLARAMARIHAAGLVHGDTGPDSVLLAVDGPYLAAFSPARIAEPAGSPMDDMADLGRAVLFAASGSEPAWAGAADDVPTLIAELEAVTSVLPPSLREVIGGCLYPDPSTRPTAAQLVDYLDRQAPADDWLPPAYAADVKAPAPARTDGVSRRNLIFGLAGGALLVGGGIAAFTSWRSPADSTPAAGPSDVASPSSSGEPDPIVLDAPDATKAWTAVGQNPPKYLAASDKVVMLVTGKSTAFLDASTGKVALPALNTTSAFGSAGGAARATYAAGVFYYLCEAPDAANMVAAVDGATGTVKWATSMALITSAEGGTRSYLPAYVAVNGNTVYVCGTVNDRSSADPEKTVGYIRAFDGATGKGLWQVEGTDINNVLVPPSGSHLLAASSTPRGRVGQVRMIDAGEQGARRWKTPIENASFYFQSGWPMTCHAAGMFFFAGGAGGTLFAVDAATGTEKWHQDFTANNGDQVRIGSLFTSLDGSTVYVPVGSDLAAFGSADGAVKWMARLTGAGATGTSNMFNASLRLNDRSAQCSADTVFVTDSAKTLWAIDAATGRARWKYNDPGQPDVGFTWTVGGDHVFIASNLTMTAISAH
jgi:outer membrane protein assembly factor BamB